MALMSEFFDIDLRFFCIDLGSSSKFMSVAFCVLKSNSRKIKFSKKHTSSYRKLENPIV